MGAILLLIITSIIGFWIAASSDKGTLIESTSLITKKFKDNEGKLFIEFYKNITSKKKIKLEVENEELWESISESDLVTVRYRDGKPSYIKAINNKLTYDKLTGYVKERIENNGNYFINFDFDQIGEELKPFPKKEWDAFEVGQKVAFEVGLSGVPGKRIE